MSWLGPAWCLAALALALFASGCESTQSKNDRLAKQGGAAIKEKGVVVQRQSKDVKVGHTTILSDQNGSAAVVPIRNATRHALAMVPLSIDVLNAKGGSLFKNDDPGLEPSLVSVSALPPGGELLWVNDQVQATGRPASVDATAGAGKAAPGNLPQLSIGKPKLALDPTSGIAAEGRIANRSKVLQRDLVLFAVALRNGRVVAAGRGGVPKLRPGKSAGYQIFFIGNPRGARISLAAPPTVLR